MYATGSESIAKGYLLMMLGIPLYLYMRWRRSRDEVQIPIEDLDQARIEPDVAPKKERVLVG